VGGTNTSERCSEIGEQDNVAIHIAEKVVASCFLSAAKDVVNTLRTEGIGFDVRFVAQTEFLAGGGGTFVGAKQNYFDVGEKLLPTT
jgi:hypothetical protein